MKEQIRPFEKEFIADKGGVISEGTKNTAMRRAIPTPNTHPIKYKKYVYHGLMKFDLKKRIDYVKFKEIIAKGCYFGSFMFIGNIISDEQQMLLKNNLSLNFLIHVKLNFKYKKLTN
ncbi:MAG: hypothetical protein ACFE9C_01635 [Candidatus Hodarchaeota archaeon]